MAIIPVKIPLCDLCLGDDGREVDAPHLGVPVSIAGAPSRALDLCERHHGELIEPLRRALALYGVEPGQEAPARPRRRDSNKHRRTAGPFRCLVPGCLGAPLKHRGSLWQHVQRLHEITLEEYIEQYGDPVPMTQEEQDDYVVEARCPVKGCDTVYSTALGNRWPRQALVSHMWGHHGIKMDKTAG